MSYTEGEQRTITQYTLDLPGTEPVETVQVTRTVIEVPGEPLTVRYQINNQNPYISIDCLSTELQETRDIIEYIISNPPTQ